VVFLSQSGLRKDFHYSLGVGAGDKVFVSARGLMSEAKEFGAPAKGALVKRWRTIAEHMSVLTNAHSTAEDKANALSSLEIAAAGLYNDLFNLTGNGPTAEEVLANALEKAHREKRTLWIEVSGWAKDLPWELLRVPSSISPLKRDCWLGEVAIVSGARAVSNVGGKNVIRVNGPPTIISVLGDETMEADQPEAEYPSIATRGELRPLEYIAVEREFIQGLRATGRDYVFVGPLDESNRAAARAELRRHFGREQPYQVIHFACHGDVAESEEDEFEAFVRTNNFRLTKQDFNDQPRIRFNHPNIAFLNMCNGLTASSLPAGGMAAYFDRSTKSEAIIASAFLIDDRSAAAITEGLLDKMLPPKIGRGAAIGRALFEVRNELLSRQESLTGFCYRLLGDADLFILRA